MQAQNIHGVYNKNREEPNFIQNNFVSVHGSPDCIYVFLNTKIGALCGQKQQPQQT